MLNVPLNTKQVISWTLFPDNLLASTEKKSVITDHVSMGDNVIASVRLSICHFLLYLLK